MTKAQPTPGAELILHSGEVMVSAGSAPASAVAIGAGRILAVGGSELLELAGSGTRIVDVAGGAILPGINDGHLHFVASAVAEFGTLDIGASAAGNWAAVAEIITAATAGEDGWIRAHGWDEVVLGEGGEEVLFDLHPGIPVVAYDQTGHQLLVNRTAAELASLDAKAASGITGGVIGTRADGSANGRLTDAAMELLAEVIPPLPASLLRSSLLAYQAKLHAWGITSLTEPGLGPGGIGLFGGACATVGLQALADLAASGELSVRVNALLLFTGTGGATAAAVARGLDSDLPGSLVARGIDPDTLRIAGVKVFADGTPRSGTAWMSEPYETPCGHDHGAMVVAGSTDAEREAELHAIVSAIHGSGLQVGIHATGDATTAAAVAAIAAAQAKAPRDARHYVIHGSFADASALSALAAHGVGYSTNPGIRAGAGTLMQRVLGPGRFARHQPLASALAAGIRTNIASDAPVTVPDWRETVIAAVTRDSSAGPGAPDDPERVSLEQALSMMTSHPAWQDHANGRKGRVAAGYLADLCVLERPLERDVGSLRSNPVTTTIAHGRIVYQSN